MTQTIGQQLKAEREEQASRSKKFSKPRVSVFRTCKHWRQDDLSKMPSPVQARGYLRNYAEYLGLNFEQLLDEMRLQTCNRHPGKLLDLRMILQLFDTPFRRRIVLHRALNRRSNA